MARGVRQDEDGPGAPRQRARISPTALGYAMGPLALALLLVMRAYGLIDRLPVWEYLVTFAAVPTVSMLVEHVTGFDTGRQDPLQANLRHGVYAAAVAWVIYMTGWGPVLVGAFTIIVVENVARESARAWRSTAAWSVAAIVAGQGGIALHLVPTRLSAGSSQVLAVLGLVVFLLAARMVGAAAEQAERADESVRQSEERFRALVQHASDTTFIMDIDGRIRFVSPAVTALLGRTPDSLTGIRATDLVHEEDRTRLSDATSGRFDTGVDVLVSEPVELRMAHADGSWRHAEAVVSDQRDHPAVRGYVAHLRDITDRAQAQAQLAHRASHDPLTGLPNRSLLIDRIEQAVARRRRAPGPPPVVMLLDCDRFKLVNDGLGHRAGDRVLVELAERLQSVLRSGDTVARLGGDEFVLLCDEVDDASAAMVLARRVMDEVERPFDVAGRRVSIGASVGVTFVEDDGDVETLLGEADFAMYLAKARDGGGRIRFFDTAARAAAGRRAHTEADLANALDDGQLAVYYQPIVATVTGAVVGAEALLRWDHPVRGVLPPADFLATAERTGLIVPIGSWVLSEACAQVRRWNQGRPAGAALGVSVNLSGRQLVEPDLVEAVEAVLHGAGVDAGSVGVALELTETMLPTDDARARDTLRRLHGLGVKLAIDDFGNGYSSLRYVRDLPIAMLKIDRSFVSGIGRSVRDESIVRSIITMARELGLQVTAEGVETAEQFAFLHDVGCELVQGYLFGRPRPATDQIVTTFPLPQHPGLSPSPAVQGS